MTSSHKKSRIEPSSDSNTELDRISDLPGNVLDQILSNLWIKDAVKTSVLSTKWRYKYETLSSLVFDGRLTRSLSLYQRPDRINKLVSIIDRVLFLHSDPIHKLKLSLNFHLPTEEIEKWIIFVSRRNLKVFVFESSSVQTQFHVPSSMFSCQSLTDLGLSNCSLQPPTTFKGFKNLKSLTLSSVYFCGEMLESLISNSPVLEMLDIYQCNCIDHLCVKAPNMKQLTIKGISIHLRLENTPRLTELSIDATDTSRYDNALCFERLFVSLPQIQRLDIGHYYVHCENLGEVQRDNSASLVKLRYLSIEVNFMEIEETLYLLGLLKCAPNLQELCIECGDDEYWSSNSWEPDNMSGPFTHLRYLELDSMSGSKAELDFISFMLLTSPALETMTIDIRYPRTKWEKIKRDEATVKITKQLLSFSRASPKAKIIIL